MYKIFKNKFYRELIVLAGVVLWFAYYLTINYINSSRGATIVASFLDYQIPLVPFFSIFYISAYILIFSPYFFVHDKKQFREDFLLYMLLIFVSSFVFLVFPTMAMRPLIVPQNIFDEMYLWILRNDLPFNLFPSLHVSLSCLASFLVYRENIKWGRVCIVWAILVALSTLFLKQHYIADVAAGIILAAIAYKLGQNQVKSV